jgi:hypothetical protein
MENRNVIQLWRVEWTHRNGYQAPHQYVEAKTRKEAIKLQQNTSSRLSDFPDSWSWNLIHTGLSWCIKRNKWIREVSLIH